MILYMDISNEEGVSVSDDVRVLFLPEQRKKGPPVFLSLES